MSESLIQRLRDTLPAPSLFPGNSGYDDARATYYTGYDLRPATIVRPESETDVARVIEAAREHDLELAVRSGGHSLAGHGGTEGGLLLDLRSLRTLDVDPEERSAWAGAGLTAGEYTARVGRHGLATGFGDTPSVGLGGITLGGGVGFLHRRLGLTIDSLLEAEIVTADGRVLRIDAESHPELFWAIRGGGGNFGVVTRFRYRLHEVDEVVGGMLILPASSKVVADLVHEAVAAPDSLSGMINIAPAPPVPFIPPEEQGRPIVMAMMVNMGPAEEGERVFAPFRTLATPILDTVCPMSYPQIYEAEAGPPPAPRVAAHPFFTDTFGVSDASTALERLDRSSALVRVVQLRVLGGAVAEVPTDATAFAHRDRPILASVAAIYERAEEADEHEGWTRDTADALRRGRPGGYVGFLGSGEADAAREAYPDRTWDRLRVIKERYDPTNLFRRNANVPPGGDGDPLDEVV